jgi:hypothetical protein
MIKRQDIRCFRFMIVRPFYYLTTNSDTVAGQYDLKFKSHIQRYFPVEQRFPGLTFIKFPGLTFIKELLRIQVAPT